MVSSLCIHHLPHPRKQALFAEILARLSPGGWFLNFDPVAADDPVVEAAWERANDRQDPAAAAHASQPLPRGAAALREPRPLHPSAGAPARVSAKPAGFEAVDVYWKRLDNVVFGGRRPVA